MEKTPAKLAKKAFYDGKWSTDNPYKLRTPRYYLWRNEYFRLLEAWAKAGQEE
jgi:hypothetical protein